MNPSGTAHILLDDRGRAWIDDTNVKVIEIAIDLRAGLVTPQQLHENDPGLSLAQIHSALAYYYDHQNELDREIDRQLREFEELRAKQGTNTVVHQRLRAAGKIA